MTIIQLPDAVDRGLGVPAAIGVDRERDVRTDGFADDANPFDIARRVDSDLHLDRRKTGRNQFGGSPTSTPRAVVKAVKGGLDFYAEHRKEIMGEKS